mmetsp:Transcript_22365/g.70080  ORF Transcript_22365/g.70080 Transcript_22365/m.70080 type:complete len:248 (+) Transcript_22365:178-921(+)
MSFFSKQPSESESLLDKAEAGECASEAESKRPALKQVLGGVVLVALALGAAASVDRGAASSLPLVARSSLFIPFIPMPHADFEKAQKEKYFRTIRVKANDEDVLTLDADVLTLSGNEQKNGATLVIAYRMKNDESQQWIYDMSTGKIKLEANPKFVVTLFLGSVVLWEDKNWPWQKWEFKDNKFTSKDSSKSQPTGCVSKRAAATPRPRRGYSAGRGRGTHRCHEVETGDAGPFSRSASTTNLLFRT